MPDTPVTPTGCSSVGGVGSVLVYGLVPSNINAGWQAVSDAQTPTWQNTGNTQAPAWAPVVT